MINSLFLPTQHYLFCIDIVRSSLDVDKHATGVKKLIPGEGLLPYLSYTGTFRPSGYGFSTVCS